MKKLAYVAAAAAVATLAVVLTLAGLGVAGDSGTQKPCRGIYECAQRERAACELIAEHNGVNMSAADMRACMSNVNLP